MEPWIGMLITGLIGVVSAIVASFLGRRKSDAEVDYLQAQSRKVMTEAELALAASWQQTAKEWREDAKMVNEQLKLTKCELDNTRTDMRKAQQQLDSMREEIGTLRDQLKFLDDQVEPLKMLVSDLWAGILELTEQLHESNVGPNWSPTEAMKKAVERHLSNDSSNGGM